MAQEGGEGFNGFELDDSSESVEGRGVLPFVAVSESSGEDNMGWNRWEWQQVFRILAGGVDKETEQHGHDVRVKEWQCVAVSRDG